MELQIIGIIASVGLLVHAVYLHLRYFKHEATCLMCNIYSMIVPMQTEVSLNGRYYYCEIQREQLFIKYLTNLAQLRILGEKEYYAYLKGDGWLTEKLDEIFGTEDIEKSIGHMRWYSIKIR